MADIASLKIRNGQRWAVAKITRPEFASVARRLVASKSRYQIVGRKTGVPWFVIATVHERESSQSFSRSLAQGDPWDRVSTHVPKGRGPFTSWEAAAVDALTVCPPYAFRWTDWTPGGTMTLLEQYNGLGYANKGLPSPYVWAGTDQYVKGKYIADGVFDAYAVDKQLGCAGLILAMQALDSSIVFDGEIIRPVDPVTTLPITPPQPVIAPPPPDIPKPEQHPEPTTLVTIILAILKAIFGRK